MFVVKQYLVNAFFVSVPAILIIFISDGNALHRRMVRISWMARSNSLSTEFDVEAIEV